MVSMPARRALASALVVVSAACSAPLVWSAGRDSVVVTGGRLAGQPIRPDRWVIRVVAGGPIAGDVELVAFRAGDETDRPGELGYTWTWGDRRESIVLVGDLAPGANELRAVLELAAPPSAGTYYILFGHASGVDLARAFSGTGSLDDPPLWGDGNDMHDLDGDDLSFARRNGYVGDWLRLVAGDYEFGRIAVAPVRVVVLPAK
ncbi:MAG TPA: hypothetical protein VD788_00345 [Candidatus Polarisedimenticolaceae bacterium]|nr:hypothetical protein [Candidatus Polarisedimenticolaceae bacterium]